MVQHMLQMTCTLAFMKIAPPKIYESVFYCSTAVIHTQIIYSVTYGHGKLCYRCGHVFTLWPGTSKIIDASYILVSNHELAHHRLLPPVASLMRPRADPLGQWMVIEVRVHSNHSAIP